MYILNEKALIAAVNFDALIAKMEETMVFADEGRFEMPLRSNLTINGRDSLMLMPCVTDSAWGCKLLTLRPENPGKGRPFLNGAVMLFDAETGETKALLEGKTVTALRTAAVAGAGLKNTANPEAQSLGLIGTGVQGFWQPQFGCAACKNVKEIRVYDRMTEKLPEFIERLAAVLPKHKITIAESPTEILENCEVIMTATPATAPLFPDSQELVRGHAFSGIGSYLPEMREFPDAVIKEAGNNIYVDTPHALDETGDLITPMKSGVLKRENIHTLAELITGKAGSTGNTTFFKSVGMALFDLTAADYLCAEAAAKGLGDKVEF